MGLCLHPVLLCIHHTIIRLFLASSNPAPITYYVPFFIRMKMKCVLSLTLHRKLCHHSSSICHIRNSNYV
jgi:hypothetical protein